MISGAVTVRASGGHRRHHRHASQGLNMTIRQHTEPRRRARVAVAALGVAGTAVALLAAPATTEPLAATASAAGTSYTVSAPKCIPVDGHFALTGTKWVTTSNMGKVPVAVELRDGTEKTIAGTSDGRTTRKNPSGVADATVWEAFESGGDGSFSQSSIDVPKNLTEGTLVEIRVYSSSDTSVTSAKPVTVDVKVTDDPTSVGCTGTTPGSPVAATTPVSTPAPEKGLPDPVDTARDLTAATRNGVGVEASQSDISVSIPGAVAGDSFFLSTYLGDGTRITPWGQSWFTSDNEGKVSLPRNKDARLQGTEKIVVQNANGVLVGWAPYSIAGEVGGDGALGDALGDALTAGGQKLSEAAIEEIKRQREGNANGGDTGASGTNGTDAQGGAAATAQPADKQSNTRTVTTVRRTSSGGSSGSSDSGARITSPSVGGGSAGTSSRSGTSSGGSAAGGTSGTAAAQPEASVKEQPKNTPRAPFETGEKLTDGNRGRITATIDGTVLNISVPSLREGDWAYIYLYSADGPETLGWAKLDKNARVAVETADMGPGSYKFALVDEKAKLLGWTDLDITSESGDVANASAGFDMWDAMYIALALAFVVVLVGAAVAFTHYRKNHPTGLR